MTDTAATPARQRIVTRFAPSPTGFLHIGGARTALFNWLFARHHEGEFLLRIEDTDFERSTPEAIEAITQGLEWLELTIDGEIVRQSERQEVHIKVAERLLSEGKAYRCYSSKEELAAMREKARAENRPIRYDGTWRDRDSSDAPSGVQPVIRLKVPQSGETVIQDLVQSEVTISNNQLDDMVLLRSDGTPTYMLSVVVDDHDMEISHVIRGVDHLTNAFRQAQLYRALEWEMPEFAHIPLIHGPDGSKLSKRHGALGLKAYADLGYLPEAVRNYLLRLGWGHGDEEIISTQQAIEWFTLEGVGRGPARIDFAKMENLNGHYIRLTPEDRLLDLVVPLVQGRIGRILTPENTVALRSLMPGLKERAKTLIELVDNSLFVALERPLALDEKAEKLLNCDARTLLVRVHSVLEELQDWSANSTETALRALSDREGIKLGKVAQPLRAAVCGRTTSPGIFDVLESVGREECLARIKDQASI